MINNHNKIIIRIPDSFIPERKYIINILLGEILGLSYLIISDHSEKNYKLILPNKNTLIIRDHFFNHYKNPSEYLAEENIPGNTRLTENDFTSEKDIIIIYGTDQLEKDLKNSRLTCGIDIFAGAFFMLTRWEEYVIKNRDNHNRFLAKYSLAYKNKFLHRPLVNEYAEMLWNILQNLGYKGARRQTNFSLELTHDVDSVLYIKNLQNMLKRMTGDLIKRKSIHLTSQTLSIYFSRILKIKKDPYDKFDYLMDISEKNNLKSRFNFLSGKNCIYDPDFFLNNRFFIKIINRIDQRGHLIGFHPSYKTYNNTTMWQKEYQQFSSISPQSVRTGRQHYLRFSIPDTWQLWDDQKMEFDSTMGYADNPGFRCGICTEYSVFNILSRKKLNLKEKPLIAMDTTFADYQKNSPEETQIQLDNLINSVKKYKGTFVLLWHNSSFDIPPWDKFQNLYEEILKNGS